MTLSIFTSQPVDGTGAIVKDAVLDWVAASANVAQFVSFGPDLAQRFCRVRGYSPNHGFRSPEERSEVSSPPRRTDR